MSIWHMDIKQRSVLFAHLAADAYGVEEAVKKIAKTHGFTKCKFYDNGGAQAYRFESPTDVVIACRGTQPSEFNDLKADLKAFPVPAETTSRVHRGFKNEVDAIKNAGGTTIRVNRGQDPEWLTDAVDYNYYQNPQALARLVDQNVHASEYSSVGLDYDHTIDNNSTIDDLHKHMELIVNS